jgi:hypothetical protein
MIGFGFCHLTRIVMAHCKEKMEAACQGTIVDHIASTVFRFQLQKGILDNNWLKKQ